eukprot:COSAG01_NODE_1369_length_10552_cov_5.204535_3_plen_201_part_00
MANLSEQLASGTRFLPSVRLRQECAIGPLASARPRAGPAWRARGLEGPGPRRSALHVSGIVRALRPTSPSAGEAHKHVHITPSHAAAGDRVAGFLTLPSCSDLCLRTSSSSACNIAIRSPILVSSLVRRSKTRDAAACFPSNASISFDTSVCSLRIMLRRISQSLWSRRTCAATESDGTPGVWPPAPPVHPDCGWRLQHK